MYEASPQPGSSGASDDSLIAVLRDLSVSRAERNTALERLFDRHHARVYEQCRRLLDDPELAADAAQDIFLGLLAKTQNYESRRHFASWLYIVVRNHCFNVLRRRRKEARGDEEDLWMMQLVDDSDPQREAQRAQTAALLEHICATKLNAREQEVVHLRYVWGLRVKQINELLGLENVSGARSHLATATRKLREALSASLGADAVNALLEEE